MTDGQNSGFASPIIEPITSNNPGVRDQKMDLGAKTGEAVSKLAQAVQQAGSQAKETATSLASEAGEKAKGLMHQQVETGADFIGDIAQSVRAAADNLEQKAPQLASLVRGVAQQVTDFSETVRHQTVEELLNTTSDFVRRNPAIVFSAAAACGFMLFRVFRAGPSDGLQSGPRPGNFGSDSRMPQAGGGFQHQSGAGSYHGT
jgi:ElaB/YqjD/DUF883 family membrane-anchored ribosome-binding protein